VRLTLRTLLAYLDDSLEPAQAKLIGQKIAENPSARELISRIKEVVRRRRLTTPTDANPGEKAEANTVAEYIDGALLPEQMAEVEDACLASDVHLAEVAACHQILTVVSSKPALVPPPSRQRMYGLIKGREAIPYRKPAATPTTDGAATVPPEANEADEALLLGLPLYRGQGAWFLRLAPFAVVLLLIGGLVFAIWQALPGSGAANVQLVKANASPSEKPAATPPAKEEPQVKKNDADPAGEPKSGGASEKGADKGAPPSSKDEAKAKPDAQAATNPPAKQASKDVAGAAKPGPEDRRSVGRYEAAAIPSVLLQRRGGKDGWERVLRDNTVYTTDYLVSLPGYKSEIRLDSGVNLLLWGDLPDGVSPVVLLESAVTIHDNPDFDLDVTLERGRISLVNHKPEGPARIRLHFLKENWELTLLDRDTEVAMELVGWPDVGFNKKPTKDDNPITILGLYCLAGQAHLKVQQVTHLMRDPRGPCRFIWTSLGGAMPAPQSLDRDQLPSWTRKMPAGGKDAQAMRQAQDNLANHLVGKASVEVVLQETLREPDPSSRILAVFSFGATDDLAALLDAQDDEHNPEVRIASIVTLRHWIGLKGENDQKLYQALEDKYRSGPAETIMELLHPYADRQKTEPEFYETLIAYLKHDKLPIRELAYSHLIALVPEGRGIPYDPAGGIDKREFSYEKWKELIPSGKLPPRNGTSTSPAKRIGQGGPKP
jgi:hypothetical protein